MTGQGTSSSEHSNDDDVDVSGGAIAGIVVGIIVGLIFATLLMAVVATVFRQKQTNKPILNGVAKSISYHVYTLDT